MTVAGILASDWLPSDRALEELAAGLDSAEERSLNQVRYLPAVEREEDTNNDCGRHHCGRLRLLLRLRSRIEQISCPLDG